MAGIVEVNVASGMVWATLWISDILGDWARGRALTQVTGLYDVVELPAARIEITGSVVD